MNRKIDDSEPLLTLLLVKAVFYRSIILASQLLSIKWFIVGFEYKSNFWFDFWDDVFFISWW